MAFICGPVLLSLSRSYRSTVSSPTSLPSTYKTFPLHARSFRSTLRSFMFGAGSATASANSRVEKGSPAPDFTAKDQKGNDVSLADFRGKSAVVLFFFPKAFTPGCTRQACAFRDANDVFQGLNATIIGISADSSETASSFEQQYKLSYTLLADQDNKIRKLYGVPSTFGLLPGRVTYVIDKNGIVIEVFNSQLNIDEHVNVARKALETMA